MIRLPLTTTPKNQLRLLTATTWGGTQTSATTWTVQPSPSFGRGGYDILRLSRQMLPGVGEAVIRYRYGQIDGALFGVGDLPAPGETYGSGNTLGAPDMRDHEIRIQQNITPGTGDATWKTIWWGQVEQQADTVYPGANIPAGERIYTCTEAIYRTRRWMLDRHAYTGSVAPLLLSVGHPGYNTVDDTGEVNGNRGSVNYSIANGKPGHESGFQIRCHTWAGAGSTWTDEDVIEHALAVARPRQQPWFLVPSSGDGSGGLATINLQGSAWKVSDSMSAFDLVAKVADMRRGRGLIFVDWDDDSGNPTGNLTIRLSCNAQFLADITQPSGTGSDISLPGATSGGTTSTVDLIGDHRVIASSFALTEPDAHTCEYLETVSEFIQVLVTSTTLDTTHERRWTDGDATAYKALDPDKRVTDRWRPVYQRYGIPKEWAATYGDGNLTLPLSSAWYSCKDNGTISNQTTDNLPSPLTCTILPDLPIYEGYIYSGSTPARAEGSGTAAESTTPSRNAPLIWISPSDNVYLTSDEADESLTMKVDKRDFWIYAPSDTSDVSYRTVSVSGATDSTASSALGGAYDTGDLVATYAIELPNRMRFCNKIETVTRETAKKRKTIEVPDLCLWLAHPGAIWGLDESTGAGRRGACGAVGDTPGLLRDDRAKLAVLHAMAWRWYGPDEPHRSCSWSLNCCGMAGSFGTIDEDGTESDDIDYPRFGDVVTTLSANGQDYVLNTPITMISYDHEAGVTSWQTAWQDLEFS